MTHHKTIAYIPANNLGKPIASQVRFLIRLAAACHAANVDYDMRWNFQFGPDARAVATLEAMGDIPEARKIAAPPREKPVLDWKPRMFEAVYSLSAWAQDVNGDWKMRPGFVLAHSCGLSLVRPGESDSGELQSDEGDDLKTGWLLTHSASGRGFGMKLSFQRAVKALLAAASHPVDWTLPVDDLSKTAGFQRAGNSVVAEFGNKNSREHAKYRLEKLAAA